MLSKIYILIYPSHYLYPKIYFPVYTKTYNFPKLSIPMKMVIKERKEKIMDMIRKAGDPDNYVVAYDEAGIPKSKSKIEIKKGKKSKSGGLLFEAKVRENLQSMGWIVDKWMNTLDYEKDSKGSLVPAKRKYNPYKKVLVIGTGFPDFIAFKPSTEKDNEVIGVEVKSNGYLDKVEKGMCLWLLENNIFSRILIAKKKKEGRKIVPFYEDFRTKYPNKI